MTFKRSGGDITLTEAKDHPNKSAATPAELRDLNAKIKQAMARPAEHTVNGDIICFAAFQAKFGFEHYDRHRADPYLKLRNQ